MAIIAQGVRVGSGVEQQRRDGEQALGSDGSRCHREAQTAWSAVQPVRGSRLLVNRIGGQLALDPPRVAEHHRRLETVLGDLRSSASSRAARPTR